MSPTTSEETKLMKSIPYKSILGQILYICITSRPDIAAAVSQVGSFAHNPGPRHWEAILQILRYLKGTTRMQLTLGGKSSDITMQAIIPTAYSDADWAGDPDKRRSRTGTLIMVNDSPVIWSSKLQATVALSSTEAEYLALSVTSREILWLRQFLAELGFNQELPSKIYEDNKSCQTIANSPKQHKGVKHVDIRYHFFKDHIAKKDIEIVKLPTDQMTADILTKQLPPILFYKHRLAMRLA
jgi:hypothetical protein